MRILKVIKYIAYSLTIILAAGINTVQASFFDVPTDHPNKEAIDFVQAQGIVSGYPDGTYQPDKKLNRAEFSKIIISSRFAENDINSCTKADAFYKLSLFSDVDNGAWFENYVCVAKDNKIIQGYGDGSFKPGNTIIYAEAAKIVISSYGFEVAPGDPWFKPFLDKLASQNAVPLSLESISDETKRAVKEI